LSSLLSPDEEWKSVDIEDDVRTCEGGGKIAPKNEKDLEDKVCPHLDDSV